MILKIVFVSETSLSFQGVRLSVNECQSVTWKARIWGMMKIIHGVGGANCQGYMPQEMSLLEFRICNYEKKKKKNVAARSPTHAPDVLSVSGSMPNINMTLKRIFKEKM